MQKLIGLFNEDLVRIITTEQQFKPSKIIAEEAERNWQKITKKHPHLWNGSVYRLDHIEEKERTHYLYLNETDYKTSLVSSEIIPILKKMPLNERPNGMYVVSFIKTDDDQYVFPLKSSQSQLTSSINLIGGNLSKSETEINSISDIYKHFLLELEEETKIEKESISNIQGLGMYLTDKYRIAIFLFSNIQLTAQEFLKQAQPNYEHANFICLTKDVLLKEINANNPKFNPYFQQTVKLLED